MDMTTVYTAVITGGLTLIGTVIAIVAGNQKIEQQLKSHNQLQDERITVLQETVSNLRDEVHENNNLKIRVPVLEEKVRNIEHRMGDDGR